MSHILLPRIPAIELFPVIEDGSLPAKATENEPFPIRATVFREGHDAYAAEAVLIRPSGAIHSRTRMTDIAPGLDRYEAWVCADAPGHWAFRVDTWSDPYATWRHDAPVKIDAHVDVELMLEEGARLMERAARGEAHSNPHQSEPTRSAKQVLLEAARLLRDTSRSAQQRLSAGLSSQVREVFRLHPLRDLFGSTCAYPLSVARTRALAGSWYEIFPRSCGAFQDARGHWVSGTLAGAAQDLPRIASMGFNVVYLTPIHPIGTTHRKGKNNSLTALPGDPGSPYGIGAPEGGHDAIHPDLGTFDDFDDFVQEAHRNDLEVALDIALQCSPDHPWVSEHPEWFTQRADGTIAYAENPPKKYQDIYPLNFDNDPAGIYQEMLRIVQHWVREGVKIFRVDNPHTKPLQFWEWLIATVNAADPDVIFLAEAFTRPAVMRALAAVGFQQSYSYFTWRNTKAELEEFLTTVSQETSDYMRPNLFVNTHDILTEYLQFGGRAAYRIRACIGATAAPVYGVYAGYELFENVARPGSEENIDNEKYEYKLRDWEGAEAAGDSLAPLLRRLNEIRRVHPALRQLRNLSVHWSDDDSVLVYSKHLDAAFTGTGVADTLIVVANVDPHSVRETTVHLDTTIWGVPLGEPFEVEDLLTGAVWTWADHNYVRLDAFAEPVHILKVRKRS